MAYPVILNYAVPDLLFYYNVGLQNYTINSNIFTGQN